MKSTRIYGLPRLLGLAALVICSSAALASAEMVRGTFTLPVEARWGMAVLPPGNYSFTLDSSGAERLITNFQSESGQDEGSVLPRGVTDQQTLDHSELLLVRTGENYTIRALRLAPVGLTVYYSMPKNAPQQMVQAPQPERHIAIGGGGK